MVENLHYFKRETMKSRAYFKRDILTLGNSTDFPSILVATVPFHSLLLTFLVSFHCIRKKKKAVLWIDGNASLLILSNAFDFLWVPLIFCRIIWNRIKYMHVDWIIIDKRDKNSIYLMQKYEDIPTIMNCFSLFFFESKPILLLFQYYRDIQSYRVNNSSMQLSYHIDIWYIILSTHFIH